jgi:hypothetical protein
VPAAIQGTLTTDRVCFDCNQRLSKLDQRFVQSWPVAVPRSEQGVPDRTGGSPPHPRQKASLEDGTRVRINTADQWRVEPFSRVKKNDDGTFTVSAATEAEAEREIEKMLAEAGPGAKVSIVSKETSRSADPPRVNVEMKLDLTIPLRMTIKMALATLSLVWDDEWLDTPQAQELHGWLHSDKPVDGKDPLGMIPTRPRGVIAGLCAPPEHLLFLQGASASPTTSFCAVVLGEHMTALEITRDGQPQIERAWWMDGVGGKTIASTIAELVARKS